MSVPIIQFCDAVVAPRRYICDRRHKLANQRHLYIRPRWQDHIADIQQFHMSLASSRSAQIFVSFVGAVTLHILFFSLFYNKIPNPLGKPSSPLSPVKFVGTMHWHTSEPGKEKANQKIEPDKPLNNAPSIDNLPKSETLEEPQLGNEVRDQKPQTANRAGELQSSQKFHSTAELSTQPKPVDKVNIDFLELASVGLDGTLILQLWLDETGRVVNITSSTTDLPQRIIDTAIQIFWMTRFTPGQIQDVNVSSSIAIEIKIGRYLEISQ